MQIEVGSILEGKVSGITSFGAFVDLPEGKSGMVHISEISNTFVENVSDFLTVGQTIKVKVLAVNENGKISLSIKRLQDNGGSPAHGQSSQGERRDRGRGDGRRGGRSNSRGGQSSSDNRQQRGRNDKSGGRQQRERKPHQSVQSTGSPGDFVWQKSAGPESFEDMMSKFKQQSDEKISTLKKGNEGYSPRRPRRKG